MTAVYLGALVIVAVVIGVGTDTLIADRQIPEWEPSYVSMEFNPYTATLRPPNPTPDVRHYQPKHAAWLENDVDTAVLVLRPQGGVQQ
jgi:hypothetical protein